MTQAVKDLIVSKKFVATLVGVIVTLAARAGLALDETTVGMIVTLFVAYIAGQSIADIGKPKAQIETNVTKTTTVLDQKTISPSVVEEKTENTKQS